MKYRPEIDGLRAVAVVPVILFHAGFEAFGGGFVGVDVFFVISGYLITSIIISEQEKGSFSIAGFYERRARRILPALFVVMAACLPFAWIWLLPSEMSDFARSLVAVSLFASNFLFWQESGYFAPAAELKPLLHTWSLAVEEQYYLLFPAFMVLVLGLGRPKVARLLALVAVLSLAAAHWGSTNAPVLTFYLLPTRGWELLLGSFAAFYMARDRSTEPNNVLREVACIAGFALILLAALLFDKNTPFPSLYALLPTVGTVLLILFATPQTTIGRFLGRRFLVGLGLISYSAYLWHQPLFAFARNRSMGSPGDGLMVTLAGLALVLAYFSWRYVELPFRNRRNLTRRQVFLLSGVVSALFVAIGAAGLATGGFASRLTPAQKEVLAYEHYPFEPMYRARSCFLDEHQSFKSFSDACAPQGRGNGVVVWGDSHAAALAVGLREYIPGLGQYAASGCPPILDAVVGWRPHCKGVNDFVLRSITASSPGKVFLHAHWGLYDGSAALTRLGESLAALRRALPNAEIVVVGPVPQWKPSLPAFMARFHVPLQDGVFLENPAYRELVAADAALRDLAARHGVRFKSALDALCEGNRCRVTTGRLGTPMPMAWDYAHLTHAGSLVLAEKLLQQ